MMAKKCFKSGCMNEVEYACKCSPPETLSCEVHVVEHVNLPNTAHNLESIFMHPCEGTKEAILEFLTIENSKYSDLRRKIIDSFSQHLPHLEEDLGDFTSKLDCYSDEINNFFAKISQASKLLKSEQDPILGLLSFHPLEAIEKVKLMTITSRDWYKGAKLFYIFNQKLESLNRSFFTEICGAYLEIRNMRNTPEMHNKTSEPTNIELANVKDSISLIINENKGSEKVNKSIKKSLENEASLLNTQISTVSNDLNSKPIEAENSLNIIDTLRNKTAKILSRPNNPELEIDFRATCSAIQTNSSFYDPPLMQAYQDYVNAYQQKTSLYNIAKDWNKRGNLIIYNTETETQEEAKTLQTPEPLDATTCITNLPNGKLFCYGNSQISGITVLIDVNGEFEVLPSGTPCMVSSCIYFNNSIYCFGGYNQNYLTLSNRFDLNWNRWIQLALMPNGDYYCHSIIFNGNILISGYYNRNLLLYSIDIDSFSTIPYDFEIYKSKILINAERLYLIEGSNGSIYESDIESCLNWRRIGHSTINHDPHQVYCSYSKGFICISTTSDLSKGTYYYFNLDQKIIIDVACYGWNYSLRRVGKKIEAIKYNGENSKLYSYYMDWCNLEDIDLFTIEKNIRQIDFDDKKFRLDLSYINKGHVFYDLKRYQEAIECYNEAILLDPNNINYYSHKGNSLCKLKRYLEAIECYDEEIKLNPNNADSYWKKGYALNELGRYPEALENYDEAIKINPYYYKFYYDKGNTFYALQRYQEAIQWYDEAIKENSYKAKIYNDKGNTLYALERYQEAIQCYGEAIRLKPSNPLYFCSRARAYNNLGQEGAALQDFNSAYDLEQEYQGLFTEKGWRLSEKDINFINDVLGRDRIELLKKNL
ncbi:unnamed protein product [Blepharisma stoltei]|uniref:Tetratricopeptide repeat protein n=1 Tax=Blepharisma stoltei TaxID=1481888 RepID=A0AAU9JU39_9CILI|nr:unnamed protein product [Blepharisma stoltei]